jgi:hypothetical protein
VHLDDHTELENTADWRSEKAEEYPNDPRNTEVAEPLTKLAADLRSIEGNSEATRFEALHNFVFRQDDTAQHFDPLPVVERWNGYRGRIGFDNFRESPKEYLNDLTKIAREIIPSPIYVAITNNPQQ